MACRNVVSSGGGGSGEETTQGVLKSSNRKDVCPLVSKSLGSTVSALWYPMNGWGLGAAPRTRTKMLLFVVLCVRTSADSPPRCVQADREKCFAVNTVRAV